MKILYIVPYAPNIIRVRPYNLIRCLAGRGNAVTVLTLTSDELDRQSVRELQAEGIAVRSFGLPRWRALVNTLRGVITPDPLQSCYCWNPTLAQEALQIAGSQNGCDVIHIEHLRGARFGQYLVQRRAGRNPPVVWDSVDSITYLFRQSARESKKLISRAITGFELARTPRYEATMARLFERTVVTSPIDRQAFLELPEPPDPARVRVLPNGVDTTYFRPDPGVARDPLTLVVSGKMSYHANVSMVLHFAQNILPLIWAKEPRAQLSIVGKDPVREIQALAGDPRITVSGYVPDIRPYLLKAAVAVAPLTYGAGIQNKVLEAMACATPVVTTPLAVRNLAVQEGRDCLVANTPERFAAAVLELLGDEDRRRALGEAGRCFVETYHAWGTLAGQLEEIYREVMAESHY